MADRCKFQKLQYQVSYNNGSTWQDVTPIQVKKGDIIEYMSQDCATIQTLYRWVDLEGTYICDGNNKYTRQIQEESYDNGVSWYTSYPTVYQQGTFVGVDEDYCCDKFVGHYQVPDQVPAETTHLCSQWHQWNGFACVYVDPIKVVKCDGTSTLTRSDTLYYISNYPLIEYEIGDSVTSIGDSAFTNCSGLTSVTIPSGVTSIGNSAFHSCFNLLSIDIPNSVTSIGNSAFTYCSGLTSISIPDSVTQINTRVFFRCMRLQSIDIPTGVTTIGAEAFWDCDSLSSVTIPDSVTTIGREAFVGCNALSEVIIGSGITSIGYEAFQYCSSLSSITVNTATPPTLGTSAFSGTSSSLKIYVPCESVSAYTSASSWSDYKKRIKGIPPCTLPNKFSAEYSDGKSYSIDCSILELTSGDTRPSDYTYSAMTSCTIGECVTSIGNGALQNSYSLTNVEIPDNVSSIGNYAFKNCRSFTSVIIPDSVTNIGQSAFTNCSGLTSITCLAVTPPTLAYSPIGGGFFQYFNFDNTNDCPIYVPCESKNVYKTTSGWGHYASRIHGIPPCAEYAKFKATYNDSTTYSAECDSNSGLTTATTRAHSTSYTAMTSAEVGECITSIDTYAFYGCKSLTSVTIGSGVTSIGDRSFEGCSGLTSVVIPDSVTSIGEQAFYGSTGLTSCTIGSGVTNIGHSAFNYCRSLTSLDIPNSVTSIGDSAFNACRSLTSVTIGNGVTNIGSSAFNDCRSLTSVTIGNGVTNIGNGAFLYCTGLTSITINATIPATLGTLAFEDTNNCPIYVPCESVNTYKTTSRWDTYASRIQGVPPCDTPPVDIKFFANYNDSTTYSAECDSNSGLTSATTRAHSTSYTAMTNAEIGSCITSIDNRAFSGFTSLTSCTIGSGVTSIGYSAFTDCSGLTSVTIPSGVTNIYGSAFANCSGLTSISIPDGVTRIGDRVFYRCTSLTSCTIGSGVTSIGSSAFQGCNSLTSVTIPSGVTEIGASGLAGCNHLQSLTCFATTPPSINYDTLNYTNNCPIYVPAASVDTYKAATNWKTYASRIQAIP